MTRLSRLVHESPYMPRNQLYKLSLWSPTPATQNTTAPVLRETKITKVLAMFLSFSLQKNELQNRRGTGYFSTYLNGGCFRQITDKYAAIHSLFK